MPERKQVSAQKEKRMPKKIAGSGLLSPTQLWGKPLKPGGPHKTGSEKTAGKKDDEDEVTDDDEEIDVDAELANADVSDGELYAVGAEVDTEEVEGDEAPDGEEEPDAADDEPDYDAEEGDVSGETEDDAEEVDKEVVAAVADDEETGEEEKFSGTKGKSVMPEKMSLSDHVRAEIARRQKAGEDPIRGKDIVEALAKKKITVSPAQVSQLMKKAGLGGKARGKRATATAGETAEKSRVALKGKKLETTAAAGPKAGAKVAEKSAKTASNGFRVPMTQLQAAEAFVDACGGSFKDAERILTAAAQLSQTFSG
jgi:hypothetical protein